MGVQRQSKHEYVARIQGRSLRGTRAEKHRLLGEVMEVTGYGRRHALRLLRHGRFPDAAVARTAMPRPHATATGPSAPR